MKKILLSFVAFVSAVVSYAQQLVATLTHGEDVSMFYGAYAYRDAMAAAVDGDVINLSGGGFQALVIGGQEHVLVHKQVHGNDKEGDVHIDGGNAGLDEVHEIEGQQPAAKG